MLISKGMSAIQNQSCDLSTSNKSNVKSNELNPIIFDEKIQAITDHLPIYTDGWKDDIKVECAAIDNKSNEATSKQ